jgi:hypothetical protein
MVDEVEDEPDLGSDFEVIKVGLGDFVDAKCLVEEQAAKSPIDPIKATPILVNLFKRDILLTIFEFNTPVQHA